MRPRSILLAAALAIAPIYGCWEMPPGNVPLSTAGEEVEILTETPSSEVYESFQELSVQAIGMSSREATVTARHMLRNRGAELGARFVSVDEASASLAWDFSGRTIMTLTGRAFRMKEDGPPTRTFEPEPRAFASAVPPAPVVDAGPAPSPSGKTPPSSSGKPASASSGKPASASSSGKPASSGSSGPGPAKPAPAASR